MGRQRRRGPGLAALAAGLTGVLLALVGCASIPTSGPVVAGPVLDGEADPGLRFQPVSPAAGASPTGIVRGFLLAASGVEDDHSYARAYLSPQRAESWRPGAATTVIETGGAQLTVSQAGVQLPEGQEPSTDGGDVTVTLSVAVVATLDAGGRYAEQPPGTVRDLTYTLRRASGQWRIAELADGLVIDQAGFGLSFNSFRLYFADRSRSFMVPETRWLPDRRSIATTLAGELLAGPSPWLAPAVVSGFPDDVALTAPAAVTVVDGEAQVDLTRAALQASSEDRALMQAQLQATLGPVPTVTTVRLTVENGELVLPGSVPALVRDPSVDPVPVAVSEGALVEVEGGALRPVDNLPSLEGLVVSNPGKGAASYAVLTDQRSRLLHVVPGTDTEPEVLLTGADLTAPSLDPHSWVWSTSALSAGVVTAARPGTGVSEVAAPWLDGRRVTSLRVSRDGTRVVVASTDPTGAGHLDLAGVERERNGRPLALVPATEGSVVPALVQVREAVWTGETEVAVLGRRAEDATARVYLTEPLGQLVAAPAPVPDDSEVVSLAAGAGDRALIVGTAAGRLWQRAGAQWVQVPADGAVRDPAFAG